MKRFLLATVALAALSAPAAAADLATKYPVKAMPAPVFSWTGFYIGANFGYGGDSTNVDTAVLNAAGVLVADPSTSASSSGFFVGGQIGYNYQFTNNVVVGLETDLQWSDISSTADLSLTLPTAVAGTYGTSLDYFGTIRARLGYAFDRFLPYITGGAAYGKTKFDAGITVPAIGLATGISDSATNWGWTIGGGVEYAITNNWTFKTEYLYVDLGSNDFSFNVGPTTEITSYDSKFHTIKAGVNYKF